MTEQWQELKETIIELRDNNGTGTQQEVCKFLANLMDVLEKQMQEPILEQIRSEIEQLHHHPKLDFIKNDEVVEMALDIIDKYKGDNE